MLSKSKAKYIQSLGHKKFRDEEALFIAEGDKVVSEILNEVPASVTEVFAVKEWINRHAHLLNKINFLEVTPEELERISQLTTPNQVLAVVKEMPRKEPFPANGKITLVLDCIQDPGNLGTIIRIADWFGIDQVVCSKISADVYNPKVVQATMGSFARMPVFYTDIEEWLKKQRTCIYAATLDGENILFMNRLKEGIILIGNESKGIRENLLQFANVRITIPRIGKAESLNAAVATGIILSHLAGKE
jgi:TrmH family RNA methyltransferase